MNPQHRARPAPARVLAILLLLAGGAAWCQTIKSVRIVVPYTPGSGPDILGRLLAERSAGRTVRPWWSKIIPAPAP
jgi:tripartite-type tricarboxylate transporter receptor subunit TctC